MFSKRVLKYDKLLIMVLFNLLLLPIVVSEAKLPFVVKSVYFQPKNVKNVPVEKVQNLMLQVQEFYSVEMDRNGFGKKTFRLELDKEGRVVVNIFQGIHNVQHYRGNTTDTVLAEVPNELKDPNNVYVYIIGSLDFLDGRASGRGWPTYGWECGGYAFIAETGFIRDVIAHEMGHAFGIYHNKVGESSLMGAGKGGPGVGFAHYEARWLDKHHYFNSLHHIDTVPKVVSMFPLKRLDLKTVQFRINVEGINDIHQIKIFRPTGVENLGWFYVEGKKKLTATIDVEKWMLTNDTHIITQVMDINGNHNIQSFPYTIPPLDKEVDKNPDIGREIQETIDEKVVYLTVNNGGVKNPNKHGLKPMNDEEDYKNGWRPDLIGDNRIQHGEALVIHGTMFERGFSLTPPDNPKQNSVLKYDLTNNPYEKFEGYIGLSDHHDWHWQQEVHANPNSCSVGGSSIFALKIDNAEIYRSPIITGKDSYIFVEFDIPLNANELEIVINASPDGNGCDSAVIGDPKLFSSKAVETSKAINSRNKLTLTWGTLKQWRNR